MMDYSDKGIAIQIDGLTKRYRLGQLNAGTLRHDLQSRWARFRHREDPNTLIGTNTNEANKEFWALKGVDLTVRKGETVGIIGVNGSGKSTLLKLICRITAPTDGCILINGRISSMLEVGTGFNPEMTGRENIYINGAILGMTKAEIDAKLQNIIAFSECEEFIDTPVKRYSSGMYVKLAFSVAAHLDNEIVIMDEVLAVGDVHFQKKCTDKMRSLSEQSGKTILFVSHSVASIRQVCDRVIVMNKGRIVFDGDTESAIEYYLPMRSEMETDVDLDGMPRGQNFPPSARLQRLRVLDRANPVYKRGEKIRLVIDWGAFAAVDTACFAVTVRRADEAPIGRAYTAGIHGVRAGMTYKSEIVMDTEAIMPGKYSLVLEILDVLEDGRTSILDGLVGCFGFEIQPGDVLSAQWDRSWSSVLLPEMGLHMLEEN